MDLLQFALVFLIILLSIFLSITGIQVFFILRDLKKALDRLNGVLKTGERIVEDSEKPMAAVSSIASVVESMIKTNKPRSPSKPKFYKKIFK